MAASTRCSSSSSSSSPSSPRRARALRALRALLAFALAALPAARLVTFNNSAPMLDDTGAILDAHDQSMQRFSPGGAYYRHAVAYGACLEPNGTGCERTADNCGFRDDHRIVVYKSDDLSSGSWNFVAEAISPAQRPAGIVYRPSAVFNQNTGTVVLGWNTNGLPTAVSASGSPEGPFVFTGTAVNLTTGGISDWRWFVDPHEPGAGYVIYSADFRIHIERLTDDYLMTRGAPFNFTFSEYFVEAPALFERKGIYYALFGWCCCFCKQGSNIMVHTAPHPLGPWTTQPSGPSYERGDVSCVPKVGPSGATDGGDDAGGDADGGSAAGGGRGRGGLLEAIGLGTIPTPGLGCEYKNASETSTTASQQNGIWLVDTADGTVEYLWVGDNWQQAPDGVKGHDPQTVLRLQFDDATGAVAFVNWTPSFQLDVV